MTARLLNMEEFTLIFSLVKKQTCPKGGDAKLRVYNRYGYDSLVAESRDMGLNLLRKQWSRFF